MEGGATGDTNAAVEQAAVKKTVAVSIRKLSGAAVIVAKIPTLLCGL